MTPENKTVLLTGGTSGIGLATAKLLLEKGYRVLIVGSAKERTEAAKAEIGSAFPDAKAKFFFANLSNQSEVHRLADAVSDYLKTDCGGKLDVLINNAGAVRDWYTTTEEGYEFQFSLNHLAGFLLSYRMVPFLTDGIILFTSSYSHRNTKIHWSDVMYQKHYFIFSAYKQSKLCNVMTAKAFNEVLRPKNIRSYAIDPGLVQTDIAAKHTSWLVRLVWSLRKKAGTGPEVPAKTYLYLIENRPKNGLYCQDSKMITYSKVADDIGEVTRLFSYSEKLCGIHFEDVLK